MLVLELDWLGDWGEGWKKGLTPLSTLSQEVALGGGRGKVEEKGHEDQLGFYFIQERKGTYL